MNDDGKPGDAPKTVAELLTTMQPGDELVITSKGQSHRIDPKTGALVPKDARAPAGVPIPRLIDRWWRANEGPRVIELVYDPAHGAFFGRRLLGSDLLAQTQPRPDPDDVLAELAAGIARDVGGRGVTDRDKAPCSAIPRALIDELRRATSRPHVLTLNRIAGWEIERGEPYEFETPAGVKAWNRIGKLTGKRFALFDGQLWHGLEPRYLDVAGEQARDIGGVLVSLVSRLGKREQLAPDGDG